MEDAKMAAIAMMLAAFPASQQSGEMVALAFLAVAATGGVAEIEQAAADFMAGRVAGHDRRFAPSTAQFAQRMRECAEAMRINAEHGHRRALPKRADDDGPWPRPRSAAERSRAAAQLEAFNRKMEAITAEAFGTPAPLRVPDVTDFEPELTLRQRLYRLMGETQAEGGEP